MNLKELFTEDRGVSPVIGVILMVAITVILAAVIGAFVLGIGGEQNATPSASISLDADVDDDDLSDSTIEIVHNGGQTLELDDFQLSINGTIEVDPVSGASNAGDTLSSGQSFTIEDGDLDTDGEGAIDDDASLRFIHEPSGGVVASATA